MWGRHVKLSVPFSLPHASVPLKADQALDGSYDTALLLVQCSTWTDSLAF
ncbi:12011_t:CDS:1, partial [Cetraspora pellucida]